jgi:hypothetical protein
VIRLPLENSPFSLIFQRQADRWAHRLVVDREGNDNVLMVSVEGGDDEIWPPSPPLQDLDLHQLKEGQRAILGVGKAGKCHWSASYLSRTGQSPNSSSLIAEIACLCPVACDSPLLGCTYRLVEPKQIQTEESLTRLIMDDWATTYRPLHGEGWNSVIQLASEMISISPGLTQFVSSRSIRWGFQLDISRL